MKFLVAALLAAVIPAAVVTAWFLFGQFLTFEANDPYIWIRTSTFLMAALAVAGAHVVALGVPMALFLIWRKKVRWWSVLGVGLVGGTVPMAIYAWPYGAPGSSATFNGVSTLIDGTPTMAGWFQYASGVAFMAAFGLVGALSFWLVWRK